MADWFAPTINMVHICQLSKDSLLPILEDDLGVESEGSTKTISDTIIDTIINTFVIPWRFPRELLMIS